MKRADQTEKQIYTDITTPVFEVVNSGDVGLAGWLAGCPWPGPV
jgi:hypothetical protein